MYSQLVKHDLCMTEYERAYTSCVDKHEIDNLALVFIYYFNTSNNELFQQCLMNINERLHCDSQKKAVNLVQT